MRAEAIVRTLDPERIVYHHSSGNLGSMHTCNFYLNWVPIQELSDWFGHWSEKGTKPIFLVEYGVPFSWDWGMYRGWYEGKRSFGSAKVPWEFCLAEWNAQFQGDRAYKISDREKQNLRWEAAQFKAGKLWNRWDYPTALGSPDFDERADVFARYITDNWRAFRALGVSANSPWEHDVFWKRSPTAKTGRKEFPVDWDKLQRPGFSYDYTDRRNWQMPTDLEMAGLDPDRCSRGADPQQRAAAHVHRRTRGRDHEQERQLLSRRNGEEADRRHQQQPRNGEMPLPLGGSFWCADRRHG